MVVVLRRPVAALEMPDEQLKALPAHVAHRAELRRRDVVVVNGPFDEQASVPRSWHYSTVARDVSTSDLETRHRRHIRWLGPLQLQSAVTRFDQIHPSQVQIASLVSRTGRSPGSK